MITDKVDDVHQAKGGSIFLNMGGRHPNNLFTVFIGASNAKDFPTFEQYKGATISVTGKIETHGDKPQIVVTSPSQIVVKQAADEKAASSAAEH